MNLEGKDPEGATPLEDEEMGGLRLGFISSRSQLDVAEYSNIALADLWLKRSQKPVAKILTVGFLRELHTQMFSEVWNWAGNWRTRMTNIGIDWHQIPGEVNKAMADGFYWHEHKTYGFQEIAVRLHHRLVAVHPFPNGNGRVTRMIADHYLETIAEPKLTWGSTDLQANSVTRRRYIDALQEFDQTGDISQLLNFAQS